MEEKLFYQTKSAVCNNKKLILIKQQKASGLLSKLKIKSSLSKALISSNILFQRSKINEKINNFLFARNKFISEIHLKQLRFTYSVCGPFTKNKKGI